MVTTQPAVRTALSLAHDSRQAACELLTQLGTDPASLVLYFASAAHDLEAIARTLAAAFPASAVVGATTAGELAGGRSLSGSVVAMAFDRRTVRRAEALLLEDVAVSAPSSGEALARLAGRWPLRLDELDPARFVGLVIPDGLSMSEETIMTALGAVAPRLRVVGGSAGDDLRFEATQVGVGAAASRRGAALVLLELAVPFHVVVSSHFAPTGRTLVATQVDAATRTVYEFDHQPALSAYARALELEPEQVDAEVLATHPVGLVIGGEAFVRSFKSVLPGGAMSLYARLEAGSELTLMRATDMIQSTRAVVRQAEADLGSIGAALVFNCILRSLEAEGRGSGQEVFKVLAERAIPAVGFHTYGEQYGAHLNQTVTMLCLASPDQA